MGLPENGGHRVLRHALPHSGAQSRRPVVEAVKQREAERRYREKEEERQIKGGRRISRRLAAISRD